MIQRQTQLLTRLLMVALCPFLLFACSSQHVLVKKSDLEAVDQCLLDQQAGNARSEVHREQLAETLELLRQTLELQQQGESTLQEFMRTARQDLQPSRATENCEAQQRRALPLSNQALDKVIIGGREKVLLTNLGIVLDSRIDTGATTSSLDAREIEIFERDGEEWVRFKLSDPELEQMVELERKRSRKVLITQSNTDEPERRPVVEMRVTIGNVTQMAEFTLSDRSHLDNPILIGRNVLRDLMIVDVARTYTMDPVAPASSENGRGDSE